jgi:hypothetical protein
MIRTYVQIVSMYTAPTQTMLTIGLADIAIDRVRARETCVCAVSKVDDGYAAANGDTQCGRVQHQHGCACEIAGRCITRCLRSMTHRVKRGSRSQLHEVRCSQASGVENEQVRHSSAKKINRHA